MSEIYVAVTVSDGEVYRLAIQTELRAPSRPKGDGWKFDEQRAIWTNPVGDAYIEYFIARNERQWGRRKDSRTGEQSGGVTVMSWRRLTLAEWSQFDADRPYRNALRDLEGKIAYDIEAARECHRNVLRLERSVRLPALDILWMRAVASKDEALATQLEAERQKLRDAPDDPRIDAAQSVEELKLIKVA